MVIVGFALDEGDYWAQLLHSDEPYQEYVRDSERNDDYTDWDYLPEEEDFVGEEGCLI